MVHNYWLNKPAEDCKELFGWLDQNIVRPVFGSYTAVEIKDHVWDIIILMNNDSLWRRWYGYVKQLEKNFEDNINQLYYGQQ